MNHRVIIGVSITGIWKAHRLEGSLSGGSGRQFSFPPLIGVKIPPAPRPAGSQFSPVWELEEYNTHISFRRFLEIRNILPMILIRCLVCIVHPSGFLSVVAGLSYVRCACEKVFSSCMMAPCTNFSNRLSNRLSISLSESSPDINSSPQIHLLDFEH